MRVRIERIMQWWAWRPLGSIVVTVLAFAILYAAFTLHQHNALLDTQNGYLSCIKLQFHQALGEAFRHQRIEPPPC